MKEALRQKIYNPKLWKRTTLRQKNLSILSLYFLKTYCNVFASKVFVELFGIFFFAEKQEILAKKCKSHPSSFSSSSLPPLFCLQFPAAHATKLQEEGEQRRKTKKTFSNILYNIKNLILHSIEISMTSSAPYGVGGNG